MQVQRGSPPHRGPTRRPPPAAMPVYSRLVQDIVMEEEAEIPHIEAQCEILTKFEQNFQDWHKIWVDLEQKSKSNLGAFQTKVWVWPKSLK